MYKNTWTFIIENLYNYRQQLVTAEGLIARIYIKSGHFLPVKLSTKTQLKTTWASQQKRESIFNSMI